MKIPTSSEPLPSQETLKALLDYNANTGEFLWKWRSLDWFSCMFAQRMWNGQYAGKPALIGTMAKGYRRGSLARKQVLAHRVAFKWMTGKDPEEVDHINGDRGDNRWSNLREVNRTENLRNQSIRSDNSSGYPGVTYKRKRHKWHAQIGVKGKLLHLGYFDRKKDAICAKKKAEEKFKFHKNHGKPQV